MWKKAVGALTGAAVLLIWLLATPLALLIGIPMIAWALLRSWLFRKRNRGKYFLVASRRRGWNDFILNNVQPCISSQGSCVWFPRAQRDLKVVYPDVVRTLGRRSFGLVKPYLVVVRRRLEVVPLHGRLKPLQATRRKDAATQRAVLHILQNYN